MKLDKKYRHQGWDIKKYKEIRIKLNKFLFDEEKML